MENLMIPRYRVEQDYPGSDFEVGMIITFGGKSSAYTGTEEWETVPIKGKNGGTSMRCIKYFEPFPAIFRPLHWHEFRDESEMPMYVKCIETPDQKIMPNTILKVDEWFGNGIGKIDGWVQVVLNTNCFEPATEQQYLTYINSK